MDLKKIADYYSQKIEEHGDTPRGVDWKDEESQQTRFKSFDPLFFNGPTPDSKFTVLDYGCGKADHFAYLEKHYQNVKYHGFDISEKMIALAQQKFTSATSSQEAQFHTDKSSLPKQVDYSIACGTFTVRHDFSKTQWSEYLDQEIAFLYEISQKGIAFNMMTSHVDFEAEHLSYIDPAQLLDQLISKYRFVEINHSYPLYEYTVIIRKNRI